MRPAGTIGGGNGGTGGHYGIGGAGGAGIANSGTITVLTNRGTISGGTGGATLSSGEAAGAGGSGFANSGTVGTLANSGVIGGGNGGGNGSGSIHGGAGGAGLSNATDGKIGSLTNATGATIAGGNGASGFTGGAGGAGIANFGTITALTNKGTIRGGSRASVAPGKGGAGIVNSGAVGTLNNSGVISDRPGGVGIANSGTIEALINSGEIVGRRRGAGWPRGVAMYSAGANASIGPITNRGKIIGNVEIDNQTSVTVTGGAGKTFGRWRGGAITIGAGNLTFAGGNTALGDDISVDGGTGTVTNMGSLQLAVPQTIAGGFTQTAAGVLGLDFAGDTSGQYGALSVTKLTTLDGGLAIDLTGGFTLATGDTFDILGFASLAGGFTGLSLGGAACSPAGTDMWACGGGVILNEAITPKSLDLVVASASAAFGPAASSAIPEPATWAMLALGFLGLSGLGLRRRAATAAGSEKSNL
jgi:hypothetical protein